MPSKGFINDVLLDNGAEIIDRPIQRQTRREHHEKYRKNKRQEFHHLLLHRIGKRSRRDLLLQKHQNSHRNRQDIVRIFKR